MTALAWICFASAFIAYWAGYSAGRIDEARTQERRRHMRAIAEEVETVEGRLPRRSFYGNTAPEEP